jgi:hypothetical protein
LPYSITLPIPLSDEAFEIVVEYEGIPSQCTKCLALDHTVEKCCSNIGKNQNKTGNKPNSRGKSYSQVKSGILETRQPFGKLSAGYGEFEGKILPQDKFTGDTEIEPEGSNPLNFSEISKDLG